MRKLDPDVKTPPRILHLQTGGGISGGIAGYVASLVSAQALGGFNFVVTASVGETAELTQKQKYGDTPIVEVPQKYGFRDFPKVLRDMHRLLREEEITLVHSHALRAGFICASLNLLMGTRFIHTNHGLRFHQKSGRVKPFVFRLLERFVVSRAERIFCIRPSDADLLLRIMPHYSDKIETILTRINLIKRSDAKPNSKQHGPPILIGIGSLIEVKRVDRFIDWLEALTLAGVQYRAVWLGDGPLRTKMEERSRNSAVTVLWRGHVDAATVSDELEHADVMLLTSDFEVLSLAALEAMASSTPIVTTDFFGIHDFVIDQVTGIILPSGIHPSKAAEQIAALLRDESMLIEMGKQAQAAFTRSFSDSEQMALAYARHYRNIMEAG